MATVLQRILLNARNTTGFTPTKVSEAQLLAAINEGKNALVRMLRSVRKDYFRGSSTASIAAVSVPSYSTVTLPSDFAELKSLEITNPGFEYIEFYPMDRADSRFHKAALAGGDFASGYGIFYYEVQNNSEIILSPGSNVALTCGIEYVKTIPDFAKMADTVSSVPDEFIEYITTYAVCEAIRSQGDARLEAYLGKLSTQANSIQDAAGSRDIFYPKYVRAFLEDEEW